MERYETGEPVRLEVVECLAQYSDDDEYLTAEDLETRSDVYAYEYGGGGCGGGRQCWTIMGYRNF